jgi:threonine dehydrogenase-like Zn-dependent dehydrogenase
MSAIPTTHKALHLASLDPSLAISVRDVPTPAILPGSCIVHVLATPVLSYATKLYSGALNYPLKPPQTIGGGAVGRIVSVAEDATTLQVGQLVLVETIIRARDDPSQSILLGVHAGTSTASGRLMTGESTWRDGGAAEYLRAPLESVYALNETKLSSLGYSITDLAYITRLMVPMGGVEELDIRSGERVVIAPATGQFGGGAVEVTLAAGADVVICGRNGDVLHKMKEVLQPNYPHAKIDMVALTGTVEEDVSAIKACGTIDKYVDFSPAAAAQSTHITSCLMSLKKGGKACLMGGIPGEIKIPYLLLMFNDLKIHGKFMYEREGVKRLISLVENGRLRFSLPDLRAYKLGDWKEAFGEAENRGGWREMVVLEPARE